MNLRTLALSASAIALAFTAYAISDAPACACVEVRSEAELNAIKARAYHGDFDAIDTVLHEYHSVRLDQRNTKIWTNLAIKVGAPLALQEMAHDWQWRTQGASSLSDKKTFANSALAVLERGYQNRHRIRSKDSLGMNPQESYVEDLREARAVNAVLNDGIEPWLAKARTGDAIAAYHVAQYYFWVDLDQKERAFWESRASQLGDPSFAGNSIDKKRSPQDDLRDIGEALRRRDILARVGDEWMQKRLAEALVERQARLRSRR